MTKSFLLLGKVYIMKNIILSVLFLLGTQILSNAQKVKKVDGDPSPLSGQTKLNIVFTYENMRVGKFDQESEYIKYKKTEYNKKEVGKGDRWEESWLADRKSRFEPNFIELFMKSTDFVAGNYPDAKYTMIVNTSRTEPGYNIYISKKNAEVDLEIKIVETATKKVVAEYVVKSAPGRTFGGYDYDTGLRIEESYATAGKYFGKELRKDLK